MARTGGDDAERWAVGRGGRNADGGRWGEGGITEGADVER